MLSITVGKCSSFLHSHSLQQKSFESPLENTLAYYTKFQITPKKFFIDSGKHFSLLHKFIYYSNKSFESPLANTLANNTVLFNIKFFCITAGKHFSLLYKVLHNIKNSSTGPLSESVFPWQNLSALV